MTTKLVLWDWNGTLLDDMAVWYKAVQEIFYHFDATPPTLDEYFSELSGHYREIYTSRGVHAPNEELDRIYERFYLFRSGTVELSHGAQETLKALHDNNVMCGIVSSQTPLLFDTLFRRLALREFFSHLRYPVFQKVETIQELLFLEGISAHDCIYIGDTPSDVRAAKKAGVVSVAYLNGYIPKSLIDAANPDHTVRDLKEILDIIEGH